MDMLKAVDRMMLVNTPTGQHIGLSIELDFDTVLKVLLDEGVFETKKGRSHRHFLNFVPDLFLSLKKKPKPYKKFHSGSSKGGEQQVFNNR